MRQRSTNNSDKRRRVEFGLYLKHLREERRLKQKKVAHDVGISAGRLSLIESGDRPVPDQILVKLAEEYGKPLEEFLGKKYWPQLPLLSGIIEPGELPTDLLRELLELRDEEKEEVIRYVAFLRLRRDAVAR